MSAPPKASARDVRVVLAALKTNKGLYTSQVAALVGLPLRRVEDAIWELWSAGRVQMNADSTLRITQEGERIFRHFAP